MSLSTACLVRLSASELNGQKRRLKVQVNTKFHVIVSIPRQCISQVVQKFYLNGNAQCGLSYLYPGDLIYDQAPDIIYRRAEIRRGIYGIQYIGTMVRRLNL